jgi:NhaP-type Na+/H+ and K+/H+ antiporter
VANAHLRGFAEALKWLGSLGPTVRGLHGMIVFIVKAFFFVFMGAMLGPLSLEMVLGVLLLLGRFLAVGLATARAGLAPPERRLVWVLLPRGLAAGVLAGLPVYAGIPGSAPILNVTYAAVLTTILIFAVAFPLARRGQSKVPANGVALDSGGPSPAADSQMPPDAWRGRLMEKHEQTNTCQPPDIQSSAR